MASNLSQYAIDAGQAVTDFRSSTNPHWNDSYLNMGAQLMLQQLENDQQLELWNLMNEYNSPANQMKRFQNAGLNPMLAYTQGTPGNASSQPGFSHANFQLSPNKDIATKISMAGDLVGMVSNLAENLGKIVNVGYDTRLKQNEALWSDFEVSSARRFMTGLGAGRNADPRYRVTTVPQPDGSSLPHFVSTLNPYSEDFSPIEYSVLTRLGKIPEFFMNLPTKQNQAEYQKFRSDYQKYYNENVLPYFRDYQEDKAGITDIERQLQQYNLDFMNMLPPEVRGIIQPVMQWLGPMFKFIFKSSKFSRK